MKRRALVLFLCAYIITAVFAVRMTVNVTGNVTENQTEEGGRADIVATEPPVWRSYEDFLFDEGIRAWDDPTAFIGATATFNIDWISEFVFAPDVDVIETIAADSIDSLENSPSLTDEEIIAVGGEDLKVVVTDYKFVLIDEESETGDLWYKVEAAEGYELPQIMKDNPYVLHLTYAGDMPTLIMGPVKGMFADETVFLQKEAVAAARQEEIFASEAPLFFEVEYLYSDSLSWYDLGDVSDWEAIENPAYHYVSANSIILIPTEVTRAYDRLMAAESSSEYWEILDSIPDEVLKKFSVEHKAKAEAYIEHLVKIENVEYSSTVKYNGVDIEVTVKGKIPETGVSLSVEPVSDNVILEGGFGIKKAEDIITALDIKILNDDSTEWQPEEGETIQVSIGVGALGYEDESIFRLQHKHGDNIERFDLVMVMDGKISVRTGGFSIYSVEKLYDDESSAKATKVDGDIELEVGEEKIFYFYLSEDDVDYNGNIRNQTVNKGTWDVVDTSGAIYYTVHSTDTSSASIGHNQVKACWIKMAALKETSEPITLTFNYTYSYEYRQNNYGQWRTQTGYNSKEFKLTVVTPKATDDNSVDYQNNGRRLYIKDLVNSSGTITAALVDKDGNEIPNGLDGAAFSWTRDDGLFIVPQAYSEGYKSVSIARDHGGLVEARKKHIDPDKEESEVIGYQPTTYELTVTLADGSVLKDEYTVYYQSEIINAGFEFPKSSSNTYSFFPNGYSELYWKTTAPGSTADDEAANVTKDIEYGDVTNNNGDEFGVKYAGDWREGGTQFAELNAEAFGSLYQDIITVPSVDGEEEEIEWSFAHAPRTPSWSNQIRNKMFIVIGATEDAQKLTDQEHLEDLGAEAKRVANNDADFLAGKKHVEITYEGAKYWVWYHDADPNKDYYNSEVNNYGWSNLSGSYTVPEGQYRTRVFFVTDASQSPSGTQNGGNLIDISQAGQYKHYLIEYYEETYVGGELQLKYFGSKTEDDNAIIYSSQPIKNFSYFDSAPPEGQGDYLHRILINGNSYPYDIRYSGKPALYIEKYPGKSTDSKKPTIHIYEEDSEGNLIYNNNNYEDYDIVMQVYFRDTVIAVEKELVLPEAMTDEQELTLFNKLNLEDPKGYVSDYQLVNVATGDVEASAQTVITQRDPKGNYRGYVALGENPSSDVRYTVKEIKPEDPEGLVLTSVEFHITRYQMGVDLNDNLIEIYNDYKIVSGDNPTLLSSEFILEKEKGIKVADVTVTNTYEEKMTTIYYKAVGNGKVAITPEAGKDPNFLDTPTEELAFYSGKAVGASVYAGKDASFVGWYTDPSCEEQYKVTAKDGVYDPETKTFKPNANILNADTVTFYAKFASFTIDIERENAAPNQTFVYKVEKIEDGVVNPEKTMYVTLACDEAGKGKVSILEAAKGEYRVTEIEEWSWRHPYTAPANNYLQGEHTSNDTTIPLVFEFTQPKATDNWLNGYSEALKNIWRKVAG